MLPVVPRFEELRPLGHAELLRTHRPVVITEFVINRSSVLFIIEGTLAAAQKHWGMFLFQIFLGYGSKVIQIFYPYPIGASVAVAAFLFLLGLSLVGILDITDELEHRFTSIACTIAIILGLTVGRISQILMFL